MPSQASCDPDVPDEFAVWALVGLPGMNGAPLPFPVGYLRKVSQRLWDAGFRHHPELQTIRYKRPVMDEHWLTSPGTWIHSSVDHCLAAGCDPLCGQEDAPSLKDYIEGLPLSEKKAIAKHLGLGD